MAKDSKKTKTGAKAKSKPKAGPKRAARVKPEMLMWIGPPLLLEGEYIDNGRTFKGRDRLPKVLVELAKKDTKVNSLILPIIQAGQAKAALVDFRRSPDNPQHPGAKVSRAADHVARTYPRRQAG